MVDPAAAQCFRWLVVVAPSVSTGNNMVIKVLSIDFRECSQSLSSTIFYGVNPKKLQCFHTEYTFALTPTADLWNATTFPLPTTYNHIIMTSHKVDSLQQSVRKSPPTPSLS